jgi:hypothetical protein
MHSATDLRYILSWGAGEYCRSRSHFSVDAPGFESYDVFIVRRVSGLLSSLFSLRSPE